MHNKINIRKILFGYLINKYSNYIIMSKLQNDKKYYYEENREFIVSTEQDFIYEEQKIIKLNNIELRLQYTDFNIYIKCHYDETEKWFKLNNNVNYYDDINGMFEINNNIKYHYNDKLNQIIIEGNYNKNNIKIIIKFIEYILNLDRERNVINAI